MNYRKRGQAPEREAFRAKFQLVDTNLEQGTFSGYASVFGSEVETWPRTIVDKGAFTKTLAESKDRVRILYQHDPYCPIGKPVEMREDDRGLYIVGKISETQMGKDALTLMRDGVLEEMSIGFDAIRWEMIDDPACPPGMKGSIDAQIRHLKEVRLWEISLVTFAADPLAQVYAVHALATVGAGYRWNKAEALSRLRTWAGFAEDAPPTSVQTVIVAKAQFKDKDEATQWVREHDFKTDKVDETEAAYRFRQFDPEDCQENSLRTIELTDGVQAVVCRTGESQAATRPDQGNQRAWQRYAQALIGGQPIADIVDGKLKLVPVALLHAAVALIGEQHMSPDEARSMLEDVTGALQNVQKILAAANGDTESAADDSGDSETQSAARAEALTQHQQAIDLQLMELEAHAVMVGVR